MKIYLGGEGVTDLGGWADEPAYINQRRHLGETISPGVLQALVERAIEGSVEVAGATKWTKIRKYRAGKHRRPEVRNVLGLLLRAEETEAQAVVFARDRDGDADRAAQIEEGLSQAKALMQLPIAGGTAREELESWILALLGERGSEAHSDAKRVLRSERDIDSRQAMVDVVNQAKLQAVPDDAQSLLIWLQRVRELPVADTMKR